MKASRQLRRLSKRITSSIYLIPKIAMAKIENVSELLYEIEQGNIGIQKHPTEDLYLLYYTDKCSFEHHWTDLTMMCRGLITDLDWNIIQRPFKKFFNYEELQDKSVIPDSDNFVAYEKIDGSLGILYWIGDEPYITTKGSWTSEQGKHATELIQKNWYYRYWLENVDRSKTYLFEIVYPEDKHIVDYGDLDTLFLIGIIDTETGKDIPLLSTTGFDRVKEYKTGLNDWKKLRQHFSGVNREGFVVLWPDYGFRLKLKYESYLKAFYLRYKLTPKYILGVLMNGEVDTLQLDDLPQDSRESVEAQVQKFNSEFDRILYETRSFLKNYDWNTQTSKEVASDFSGFKYSPVAWAIWNKRSPDILREITWKCVKKEFENETRE